MSKTVPIPTETEEALELPACSCGSSLFKRNVIVLQQVELVRDAGGIASVTVYPQGQSRDRYDQWICQSCGQRIQDDDLNDLLTTAQQGGW